jgi:branched-chain amino acid transport system ATP-binding protein
VNPAAPNGWALEVRALTKLFGGLLAVDRVSLGVRPRERHALIGPNGAGKTTLFNCMAGNMRPSSGQGLLFGDDVTRVSEPQRSRRGLARTYQITNLFPRLTAFENVILAVQAPTRRLWMPQRRVDAFADDVARARTAIDRVGLGHRRDEPVNRLSYGERRQLELALALAVAPRVLLLDEPMAGLSPVERERLVRTIAEIPREVSILLIEHNVDVVLELADRITVLNYGRVVVEGTPAEIRSDTEARKVYLGDA